jgi:hypothetical protein
MTAMPQHHHPASDTQAAYDAWVDHARTCPDCMSTGSAESSTCQTGTQMWAEYKAAHAAAETTRRRAALLAPRLG